MSPITVSQGNSKKTVAGKHSKSAVHLLSSECSKQFETVHTAMNIATNKQLLLSIMVRYLNGKEIIESFVTAIPVASTTEEVITSTIVEQMKVNNLDINNLVEVSFDSASHISEAAARDYRC